MPGRIFFAVVSRSRARLALVGSTDATAHQAGQIRDDLALELAVQFTFQEVQTSLAPKHNVLWRSSCEYSSHKSCRLLNRISVEHSLCALTQEY